jgi:hypothetical protein
MEAVIDPAGPTIVGQVPPGACRDGGAWADFVTVPIPDGLEGKPLKAELVDDVWVISLDVDTVTAAAWTQLRAERNRRLAACDWTQMSDSPLSQDAKASWSDYRQELRDLPDLVTDEQVTSSANSVPWPVDPTQAPVVQATGSRLSSLLDAAQV